jgi:predicted permease
LNEGEQVLKDKSAFLFDVINRYDHYVATTNFKVGLMMSFVGAIILGLTIRVMLLNPPQEGCNYFYYAAIFSSALTILCSLVAAISLLRAVFPNTKFHDGDKSLIFFGDVANCENGVDGYAQKIHEATQEGLLEDLSKQTFIVAEVINEKFRILKIAVRTIIWGVIPLLAVSILLLMLEGVKR